MLPIFAWATGAVFFFYAFVLRVAPSVMVDELMRDLSVSAAAIGNLSAFYFYSYAGLQIPIGMMIDRFGPRRLMTVAAYVCAGGCILFAQSESLAGLAGARFIIGASAAFSFVGAMAVAGQWFPASRFALLSGLAMMLGMAGGVFGQAPLRLGVEAVGWRHTMLALALGGVLLAIMAFATVRDKHRGTGGVGEGLAGLRHVMRNRQTWLIAFAGLGTTGPLLGFAGLWGVPYLTATQGLTPAAAAGITSMLFLGWGIGAPIFGWLSDRIGRRKLPFIVGLAICTATIAAIVLLPGLTPGMIAALCFICGFGGASQIVGFAAARESNAANLSGTAIGFVNGVVTGAGALYQPLLGWMLDLSWTGTMASGVRVYDAAGYRFAFVVLIAGSIIGFICTLLIRETHCRQVA